MSEPRHRITIPHEIDFYDALAALHEEGADNTSAVIVEFLGGLNGEDYATVAAALMGFIQMNPAT